jgi:hypothetical protein
MYAEIKKKSHCLRVVLLRLKGYHVFLFPVQHARKTEGDLFLDTGITYVVRRARPAYPCAGNVGEVHNPRGRRYF